MGFLDVFKKKKDSADKKSLPELPEISTSETVEDDEPDLPPLPEIKSSPGAALPEVESSDDSAPSALPELPEIKMESDESEETVKPVKPTPAEVVKESKEDESEPEPVSQPVVAEVKKPAPMNKIVKTKIPDHIFVSTNDYQKIMDGVNFVKSKFTDAGDHLKTLEAVKTAEKKQLDSMRSLIEDTQRKITYVDEVIFQAE